MHEDLPARVMERAGRRNRGVGAKDARARSNVTSPARCDRCDNRRVYQG
jgi:hypothetical protein